MIHPESIAESEKEFVFQPLTLSINVISKADV